MAPPAVMMKVPIPAPIHVPAAPVVDNSTAEVTEPRPEPIAPIQLISGPFFVSFDISLPYSPQLCQPAAQPGLSPSASELSSSPCSSSHHPSTTLRLQYDFDTAVAFLLEHLIGLRCLLQGQPVSHEIPDA